MDSTIEDEFGQLLLEFYERFSAWEHDVVAESGLTPAQMHALEMLGHMEQPTMKELAARLGVTTGTLTAMVDRLEKQNLVQRTPNPQDRRSYVLILTVEGQAHFETHHAHHQCLTQELSAGFKQEELGLFVDYLNRLIERV